MTKTENRNDKLRAAHDKLQDAVEEIVSGDDWKRMLKVASEFHRYSFNNHQVQPHSIGPPGSAAISCGGSAFGRKNYGGQVRSFGLMTSAAGPGMDQAAYR